MGYMEKTPDKATKIELIKTLQTVTEGKVSKELCVQTVSCCLCCWASESWVMLRIQYCLHA